MSKDSKSSESQIETRRWTRQPLEYRWLLAQFPNDALDPWFPLAMEINDALTWARGGDTLLAWPWQADDFPRDWAFKALKEQLAVLEVSHPFICQRVTQLDQKITKSRASESGTLRFHIVLAYQTFEEEMGALPRLEELRYAVWAISAYSARRGGSTNNYVASLPDVYNEGGRLGFPHVTDKSQFARTTKSMGLRLYPGGNALQETQANLSRRGFSERWTLDDLVDYLACSGGRSESRAWTQERLLNHKGEPREIFISYIFKPRGLSQDEADRCCAFFKGIERLDILLCSFFGWASQLHGHASVAPLRRGVAKAVKKFGAWPTFSQFLCGCDETDLNGILNSDLFVANEKKALLDLVHAMAREPAQKLCRLWEELPALRDGSHALGLISTSSCTVSQDPAPARHGPSPAAKHGRRVINFTPTESWSDLTANFRRKNFEWMEARLFARRSSLIGPAEQAKALSIIEALDKDPKWDRKKLLARRGSKTAVKGLS